MSQFGLNLISNNSDMYVCKFLACFVNDFDTRGR